MGITKKENIKEIPVDQIGINTAKRGLEKTYIAENALKQEVKEAKEKAEIQDIADILEVVDKQKSINEVNKKGETVYTYRKGGKTKQVNDLQKSLLMDMFYDPNYKPSYEEGDEVTRTVDLDEVEIREEKETPDIEPIRPTQIDIDTAEPKLQEIIPQPEPDLPADIKKIRKFLRNRLKDSDPNLSPREVNRIADRLIADNPGLIKDGIGNGTIADRIHNQYYFSDPAATGNEVGEGNEAEEAGGQPSVVLDDEGNPVSNGEDPEQFGNDSNNDEDDELIYRTYKDFKKNNPDATRADFRAYKRANREGFTQGDKVALYGGAFGTLANLAATVASRKNDLPYRNVYQGVMDAAIADEKRNLSELDGQKRRAAAMVSTRFDSEPDTAMSYQQRRARSIARERAKDKAVRESNLQYDAVINQKQSQIAQMIAKSDIYEAQGEQQARTLEQANRDAFYSGLSQTAAGITQNLQQLGAGMNQNRLNKTMIDTLKSSNYKAVTGPNGEMIIFDGSGNIVNAPGTETPSDNTNTENVNNELVEETIEEARTDVGENVVTNQQNEAALDYIAPRADADFMIGDTGYTWNDFDLDEASGEFIWSGEERDQYLDSDQEIEGYGPRFYVTPEGMLIEGEPIFSEDGQGNIIGYYDPKGMYESSPGQYGGSYD